MVETKESGDHSGLDRDGSNASEELPDVSIVIRAKNEAKHIGKCIESIISQKTRLRREIIVLDSGSTDRTPQIAGQYPGVTLRHIPPDSFNYGDALNQGTRLARGRYVVALSAHCIPVDEHWLDRLVEPLERDQAIAGSFGRQLHWPGCEPVERHILELEFKDYDYVIDRPVSAAFPTFTLYSNANSCFRRSMAVEVPFLTLPWAEDRVWAHEILRMGHKIAYVSGSAVHHSHSRTILGYFRIGYLDGMTQAQLGYPDFSLRTREWFGLRCLKRCFVRWRNICERQGVVGLGLLPLAFASLCRYIALDLGTWRGLRTRPADAPRRVAL